MCTVARAPRQACNHSLCAPSTKRCCILALGLSKRSCRWHGQLVALVRSCHNPKVALIFVRMLAFLPIQHRLHTASRMRWSLSIRFWITWWVQTAERSPHTGMQPQQPWACDPTSLYHRMHSCGMTHPSHMALTGVLACIFLHSCKHMPCHVTCVLPVQDGGMMNTRGFLGAVNDKFKIVGAM